MKPNTGVTGKGLDELVAGARWLLMTERERREMIERIKADIDAETVHHRPKKTSAEMIETMRSA